MLKQLHKLLFLLSIFSAFISSSAHAMMGATQFSLMGGINSTLNNGGSLGYLGGAMLDVGLGGVALEGGAMFLSRAFSGYSNQNYLRIPVLLRFPVLPFMSLGLGGYYDVPLSTFGYNIGAIASLRFKPIALPVFVDGRFNYGLNNSTFGNGINDVSLMLGILF